MFARHPPPEPAVIRPTTPDDTAAILALAVATGLAPPDATDELRDVLASHFAGTLGRDHTWVTDDDGGPVGVAYFAPERLTEGTWNLYMIAVRPDLQGRGRGAALLRHAEETLAARGERLLLVDTSGLPEFERTRAFYRKCGYDEEARVREFWKAGDDKVVFRKALAAPGR
ncbi:MAG: GNAT family N-acetyltransferase [Isosphaera sp.]|nr:GNAT family N-acetyltransferase [Isosphaera sp.]